MALRMEAVVEAMEARLRASLPVVTNRLHRQTVTKHVLSAQITLMK